MKISGVDRTKSIVNKPKYVFFTIILSLVPLFSQRENLIDLLPFLYSASLIFSLAIIIEKKDVIKSIFSPSAVLILYVSFFFAMGANAFKYELVQMYAADQYKLYNLPYFNLSSFYVLISIATVQLSHIIAKRLSLRPLRILQKISFATNKKSLLASLVLLIISSQYKLPLPGGVGSFSSTIYFYAAVHLSYYFQNKRSWFRHFIYLALFLSFVILFYEDRRVSIFYLFVVSFIELYKYTRIKLKILHVVYSGILVTLIIVSIVSMSIYRGVGGYKPSTFAESFSYVDDYLTSPWAKTMLYHNTEGPSTFFHTYKAIGYVLDEGKYAYGSTIIKVVFLPFPRSIISWKPRSMVDEYTNIFYPIFRSVGGSYVPNLIAESIWNYGIIGGLIFLFFLLYLLDILFYRSLLAMRSNSSIENIAFASSYAFIVFYFRGSGLELYFIYVIINYSISFTYSILFQKTH